MQLSLANDNRKKVAVISHERSGTHFLMNSIAQNFAYLSEPWWNFDYEVPINFHSGKNIENYFRQAHDQAIINVLKSHHDAGFFTEALPYLSQQFHIFYVYRDPRDVMLSNWKLINQFQWDEGPKTGSVSEFIRTPPAGAMMRYQKIQHSNMLQRWKHHLQGWLEATEQYSSSIHPVKYEDLNLEFDTTIQSIGHILGLAVDQIQRPSVDKSVIGSGKGQVASYKEFFNDEDEAFVSNEIGNFMQSVGYGVS